MMREPDAGQEPDSESYLRLTRVSGGHYRLDLWPAHVREPLQAEADLPPEAVDHITRVLRDIYYQPSADILREIAGALWSTFLPEEMRGALDGRTRLSARHSTTSRRRSRSTGGPRERGDFRMLRIELRDPSLHYLPWEYLPTGSCLARFEPSPRFGAAAQTGPGKADLGALSVDLPLRVLFAAASPRMSKMAIDVAAEYDRMARALDEIGAEEVEVVPLLDPDRDALAAALSSSWFHILHVACHGLLASSGPMLALQSGGRSQFLSPAEMGGLARAGGVRLLALQSPVTALNYQIAAFAGFAAHARVLGLPALLFDLVPDDEPVPVIARVYAALARGQALDKACHGAVAAGAGASPVLGLSLHTREPRLFRPAPRGRKPASELLEAASDALQEVMADPESPAHHRLVELVESGATEEEVAELVTLHVKGAWPSGRRLPGGRRLMGEAAEEIGKFVAHQVIQQPQALTKGIDLSGLDEAARPESQHALQELDYVTGNVAQLEQMQATYKAPPLWLDEELAAQRDRLDRLRDELEGEE